MSPLEPESVTPAPAANVAVSPTDPAARGGFFEKRFVQEVLPFLTSLSLHVGIVIVAVLAFAAIKVMREPPHKQITSAEVEVMDQSSLLGFRGTAVDKPWLHAMQDEVLSTSDSSTNGFKDHSMRDLAASGGGADGDAPIIAVGSGGFGYPGASGIGRGLGQGHDGDDGQPSLFGNPQMGGLHGAGAVFCNTAVRRIAYVCDVSGSVRATAIRRLSTC